MVVSCLTHVLYQDGEVAGGVNCGKDGIDSSTGMPCTPDDDGDDDDDPLNPGGDPTNPGGR